MIPTSAKVSTVDWDEEIVMNKDLCLDAVSDRLSNTYGFCHDGFDAHIETNSNGKIINVTAINIKWDFS